MLHDITMPIDVFSPKMCLYSLSYASWLSLNSADCTNDLISNLVTKLEKEAKHTSDYLAQLVDDHVSTPNKCSISCLYSHPKTSAHNLYNFSIYNQEILKTICTHLDKQTNSNIFSDWLHKKYHNFSFNHGLVTTRLTLETKYHKNPRELIECPICYEDITKAHPSIILQCGHVLCIKCLKQVYKATNQKGTLINIITYQECSQDQYCPICRFKNPCGKLKDINIWSPGASIER